MKKQRKKARKTPVKNTAQTVAATPEGATRRAMLRHMRNAAIALPVLGVGGVFAVRAVEASICELDLSKVGNGLPSIVQVHDQNCPLCQTLQRQTRRVLRAYDDEGFRYLVANVNTVEGAAFAQRHGASNVTLIFFDARGEPVNVLQGPVPDATLERAVAAHLRGLG